MYIDADVTTLCQERWLDWLAIGNCFSLKPFFLVPPHFSMWGSWIGFSNSCLQSLRVNRFNPIQLGSTRSSKSCRLSQFRCQATNLISGDVQVPRGRMRVLTSITCKFGSNLLPAAFLTWPCWITESWIWEDLANCQRNDAEKTCWWISVIWTATTTGDSTFVSNRIQHDPFKVTQIPNKPLKRQVTRGRRWIHPDQKKKWRFERPMWCGMEGGFEWESASERRRKHHKTSTSFLRGYQSGTILKK